jgi:hypothetical protein
MGSLNIIQFSTYCASCKLRSLLKEFNLENDSNKENRENLWGKCLILLKELINNPENSMLLLTIHIFYTRFRNYQDVIVYHEFSQTNKLRSIKN